MPIDELSLLTTPVLLFKGTTMVSQGTGFLYLYGTPPNQTLYLVTNIHVLTGHGPLEGKPPIGDAIQFQFHQSSTNPGAVKTIQFPLFTRSGNQTWIETSVKEADVAVIPIPTNAFEQCDVQCIDSAWLSAGRLRVRPASSVTLVGYPYGYYDKMNALPVFKTGSVASEPWIDFEGKPLFLVDVAAFPGMSGAPVFAVAYGMYEDESGNSNAGSARRFLGVYASMQMLRRHRYLEQLSHQVPSAGRFGVVTQESLQIGHVWKGQLVEDTVASVDVRRYEKEILRDL